MELTLNISDDRIVDLFISACEGGSNYWVESLTPKRDDLDAYQAMLHGFTLIDGETSVTHDVSIDSIKNALNVFPVKAPRQFADFIKENDDAETADCFLQLCVFGEIIYG